VINCDASSADSCGVAFSIFLQPEKTRLINAMMRENFKYLFGFVFEVFMTLF
jgi:hypothetical protein